MSKLKLSEPVLIALSGLCALAIAMGIGRFSFTAILPIMQSEGKISLANGGLLASANYIGYFVGALLSSRLHLKSITQLLLGIGLVIATTFLMGLINHLDSWLLLRFISGGGSALVLVSTSALCVSRLVKLQKSHLAGIVFTGVGTGITLVGLIAFYFAINQLESSHLWLTLGGLSIALIAGTQQLWKPETSQPVLTTPSSSETSEPILKPSILVLCYGLMGFGYILPATFLPAQARLLLQSQTLFGLAWPIFGITAAISTYCLIYLKQLSNRSFIWAICQIVMALGIALPLVAPNLISIMLAATAVGGTFMIITMLGLQEAQRSASGQTHRLMGKMTSAFAIGQLLGPIVVKLLLGITDSGMEVAQLLAITGLVISSLLLLTAKKSPIGQEI